MLYVTSLTRELAMKDARVDKQKFDGLLRAMINTQPLPKSEVKVKNPKPKK